MAEYEDDRISNLPDEILTQHILSRLTTQDCVRTTVLSSRWDRLFTLVPVLNFHEYYEYNGYSFKGRTAFINLVNSVFILNSLPRINKFSLEFLDKYEHHEDAMGIPIISWISAAIHKNVEQMDISYYDVQHILPRSLFICKTLTHLNLHGYLEFRLPHHGKVCLPCLKSSYLCDVTFDDQSARRFFRSCPVLEYLYLGPWNMGEGAEVLVISAFALKHLIIMMAPSCKVVLDVPNLIHFEYEGHVNEFLGLESLKSVIDASISHDYEHRDHITDGVVVKLVCSISHVQQLSLWGDVIKAFLHLDRSFPTFNNLTSFQFDFFPSISDFCLGLLDKSPQLECLSLHQGGVNQFAEFDDNDYCLPEHVPECVSLHLKEVHLSFLGLHSECKLLEYFRKYARNLKIIYWGMSDDSDQEHLL